jgi:hypothetical protein
VPIGLVLDSCHSERTLVRDGSALDPFPPYPLDGQSVLLLDQRGTGAVIKVRLSDGKKRILDLKDFVGARYFSLSLSLAPDDSPLLLKETGSQDIAACPRCRAHPAQQ